MKKFQAIAIALAALSAVAVAIGIKVALQRLEFPAVDISVRIGEEQESDEVTQRECRLGFDGCCPVTLLRDRRMRRGNPVFQAEFAGNYYHFISKDAKDEFLRSPTEYAPVLTELDIVSFVEQGKMEFGVRQYGIVFRRRIFLFASPENRASFEENFERYYGELAKIEAELPALARREQTTR